MRHRVTSITQEINELGFTVVRNLLSPKEASEYRTKLLKRGGMEGRKIDSKKMWLLADGPAKCEEWWPLIMDDRILNVMREVMGPDVIYVRNADLQINNDRRIWHRDSPCRQFGIGPDFDESRAQYKVLRIGIYLQSYQESGSALGFIPGSHRRESAFTRFELGFWERVASVLRKQYLLPPFVSVRPTWVKTEPGDAIIFDARVLHAPSQFHGPKLAVFLSYGANNEHSLNFHKHYVHDRKTLQYGPLHPELKRLLAQKGLLLDDKPTELSETLRNTSAA